MTDLNIFKDKKNIMKLDKNDLNILAMLWLNGRFTIKEIAKHLGLSREVVQYKIKNYEKKGLIKRWDIALNHNLLNQNSYDINLFFNYDCPQKIIDELMSIKNIEYLGTSNLNSRILIDITIKDSEELKGTVYKIKKICKNYLKEIFVSINLSDFYCNLSLFPKVNNLKKFSKTSFQKEFLLKKEDFSIEMITPVHYKIIDILNENCREPILSISEKTGISINTTIKRIKELIKWGIITEWSFVIDYSLLGLSTGGINIKTKFCSPEDEKKMESYFKNSNKIFWCTKCLGVKDYVLDIAYKTYDDVLEIIQEIKLNFDDKIKNLEFVPIDKGYVWREHNPH